MVVIRLSLRGAKHKGKYRITVADSRRSVRGKFIEIIGRYNPLQKDKKSGFFINREKYNKWVSQGARPSRTLLSLVKKMTD